MVLLFRKLGRSGVFEFGKEGPVAAVRNVTRLPMAVIEAGLSKLFETETALLYENNLVFPNFLEAQEANMTGAERKRKEREKHRDLAQHGSVLSGIRALRSPQLALNLPADRVTKRDADVTKRDAPVDESTRGHQPSTQRPVVAILGQLVTKRDGPVTGRDQTVTPSLAVPSEVVVVPPEPPPAETLYDGPSEVRQTEIACPRNLWEHFPEEVRATLRDPPLGIPDEFQHRATATFVAKFVARAGERRTLDQWITCTIAAIQGDWQRLGDVRPAARPAATRGAPPPPAPAPLPSGYGGPLSQRLFGGARR